MLKIYINIISFKLLSSDTHTHRTSCSTRTTKVIAVLTLDMSAAFDTTDLSVLLGCLMSDFGITGRALNWLRSFAADRTQCWCWNCSLDNSQLYIWCSSRLRPGPFLFALYVSPINDVIAAHSVSYRQYADDTQYM